ncbi:MAG TPA: cellulase family glycosylhydrolase [Acidimicrobiales bacterium]|nr:cellulase family glycosylhydrolase [Acidimicrobiales bacterium]
MRRRAFVVVLAAVTGVSLAVPAAEAGTPGAGPGSGASGTLPWLTVSHPAGQRPRIVDPDGRTVILRGVNVVGVEDDFYTTPSGAEPGPTPVFPIEASAYDGTCPAMTHRAGEAPVCEVQAGLPEYEQSTDPGSHDDLAQMRALGFNFVRLALSWSQLELTPGRYSTTYLDRIAQVVGWAREQGIYVLLDMHQDAYSRFTPDTAPVNAAPLVGPAPESSNHADGAPPWAVLTDGVPAEAPAGVAEFNSYVEAAFTSFWLNRVPPVAQGQAPGPGLQDHYIGAMAALARRFGGDPTVVGYEIMNEPLPGFIPPAVFSATELYPFYSRVMSALTGTGGAYRDLGTHIRRQSFFFEPMAVRNLEDAPDQAAAPFSTYPNLVYAPHTYTHVFTADAEAGVPAQESPYPVSYGQAYQVADAEARSMHAALISGEYGNSAGEDDVVLKGETAAQDAAMVGSTLWAWKGSCAAGTPVKQCYDAWSVYAGDPATPPAQSLGPIPTRVKYLARIYPQATVGTLDSFAYDPDHRSFTMTATADTSGVPTVIFLPAGTTGRVTVQGAARPARTVAEPDGTARVLVYPTGRGVYSVTVG